MVNAMFLGILNSVALESMASDFIKQRRVQTSRFGYCFNFRFVPDVVLRSRTLSTPVEMDWACLIKHCRSR